jgi:Putative polyhydroxyalkanoic acid system protein (PHA_gran_rgn)
VLDAASALPLSSAMTKPVIVDLPHTLGAEEAKRRISGGIGRIGDHIPGGASNVETRWEGDRMHLKVAAMGQTVACQIDVQEKIVRLEVLLPGILGMFSDRIAGFLRKRGGDLLEDKSKRRS